MLVSLSLQDGLGSGTSAVHGSFHVANRPLYRFGLLFRSSVVAFETVHVVFDHANTMPASVTLRRRSDRGVYLDRGMTVLLTLAI